MVQMSITVGNAEKSIGAFVLIATMIVTNASSILSVNSTSSIIGGKGSTSMVSINSITAGTASEDKEKLLKNCRNSDNVKLAVVIYVISLLVLNFRGFDCHQIARSHKVMQIACLKLLPLTICGLGSRISFCCRFKLSPKCARYQVKDTK